MTIFNEERPDEQILSDCQGNTNCQLEKHRKRKQSVIQFASLARSCGSMESSLPQLALIESRTIENLGYHEFLFHFQEKKMEAYFKNLSIPRHHAGV